MDEFFQKSVIMRIESLQERQERLEERLLAMQESQAKTEASVTELVDILQSWRGAMKVLDLLGKLAKPVAAIAAAIAAVVALFHWGPPK